MNGVLRERGRVSEESEAGRGHGGFASVCPFLGSAPMLAVEVCGLWSAGKVIGECGFAARDADPEASGANLDLGKPCPSEAEAPLVLTLSLWE